MIWRRRWPGQTVHALDFVNRLDGRFIKGVERGQRGESALDLSVDCWFFDSAFQDDWSVSRQQVRYLLECEN